MWINARQAAMTTARLCPQLSRRSFELAEYYATLIPGRIWRRFFPSGGESARHSAITDRPPSTRSPFEDRPKWPFCGFTMVGMTGVFGANLAGQGRYSGRAFGFRGSDPAGSSGHLQAPAFAVPVSNQISDFWKKLPGSHGSELAAIVMETHAARVIRTRDFWKGTRTRQRDRRYHDF